MRRQLAFREMAQADAVVTPSDAMAAMLRAWRSCPDDVPQHTVHHAVDSTRFEFHPRLPTGKTDLDILMVGHPAPHKDLPTAVRAIAELKKLGLHARLRMTKDRSGYDQRTQTSVDELVTVATALGVDDQLVFAGRSDSVESLFRSADVLLMPSRTESFGFALVEAMAAGLPVVSSSISASVETTGGHAWFFSPGDPVGAAAQIAGLTRAGTAEMKMLDSARLWAERHNWDSNAQAVAELIENVIANPRGLHRGRLAPANENERHD
jgi:glycosyltransferase involved in cell wall biosynthesis